MQVSSALKIALSNPLYPDSEKSATILTLAKQYFQEKQSVTALLNLHNFKWLCTNADSEIKDSLLKELTTAGDVYWAGKYVVDTREGALNLFLSGALNIELPVHRRLVYALTNSCYQWDDRVNPIFEAIGKNLPSKAPKELQALPDPFSRGLMFAYHENNIYQIYLRTCCTHLANDVQGRNQLVGLLKSMGEKQVKRIFLEEFDQLKLTSTEYIRLFVDAGVDPRIALNRKDTSGVKEFDNQLRTVIPFCDVKSMDPNPIHKAYQRFCEACKTPTRERCNSMQLMLILAEFGCEVDPDQLHPTVRDLQIPYLHKLLLSGFLCAPVPRDLDSLFKEPEENPLPLSGNMGLPDAFDYWKEQEGKRYRIPEELPEQLRIELLKTMLKEPTLDNYNYLYCAGMTTAFNSILIIYSILLDEEALRIIGSKKIFSFNIHLKQDRNKGVELCRLVVNLTESDFKPFAGYPVKPEVQLIWALFSKSPLAAEGCNKEYLYLNCDPRILEATQHCAIPWDDYTMSLIKKCMKGYTEILEFIWSRHFGYVKEEAFQPWVIATCFLGMSSPKQRLHLFLHLLHENYDTDTLLRYFGKEAEDFVQYDWKRITGKECPSLKVTHLAALKDLLVHIPDNQFNDGIDTSVEDLLGRLALRLGPSTLTADIVRSHLTKEETLALAIAEILLPFVENEFQRQHLFRFSRVQFMTLIILWLQDPTKKSPDPLGMVGWNLDEEHFKMMNDEMAAKYKAWEKVQTTHNLIDLEFVWKRDHTRWGTTPLPIWYCNIRRKEIESSPETLASLDTFLIFGEERWRQISQDKMKPFQVVRELFSRPREFAKSIGKAVYTEYLGVEFRGRHQHTGLHVMRTALPDAFLKHTKDFNKAGQRMRWILASEQEAKRFPFVKPLKVIKLDTLKAQIPNLAPLGRSFVQREGHEIQVYKITRSSERSIKEPAIVVQLTEEKGLKSNLPKPLCYQRVNRLSKAIYKPIEEQGIGVNRYASHVYTYRASADYIRYLNGADVSDAEFKIGHKAFVYDAIFILRTYGLILNVADLFHNNEQGRRLLVMRDLFNENRKNTKTSGLGRIDNVPKAVRYPNARVTGLADYADAKPLEEIQQSPVVWARDLENVSCTWEPMANGIGEILLTDLLLALTRLDAQGRLDWENEEIQKLMIKWAQESCVQAFLAYTKRPEEECVAFIRDCGFDWLTYVQESMFWYQNNDGGYLGALKKGKLPECLLPKKGTVTFRRATAAPNFHFKLGASSDGVNKDIGLFNASAGLTNFELLVYQLTTMALCVAEGDFLETSGELKSKL